MSPRAVSTALAIAIFASSGHSGRAADLGPLLQRLEHDPSFKVRLQAARILVRRAEAEARPSPAVLEALDVAVRTDPHRLVRAYAIRALGDLAGPDRAGLFALVRTSEEDSFVRAQAELAHQAWSRRTASVPLLVLIADAWVTDGGKERTAELSGALRRQAERVAEGRFRLAPPEDGRGYLVRVSVAGLESRREGEQEVVTLKLKLALATWPERNLRQIVTARASARVSPSYRSRDRLRKRLLDDAVRQALSDALVQIEGS